jgi:signal peptidase I
LICVFLALVIFFVTTFRMCVVKGRSMEPTYVNGQVVLVRRRTRFSAPLGRNDVVLLSKDRDVIIKRVYRLSGERLDDYLAAYTERNRLTDYYEQSPPAGAKGGTRYTVQRGYLVVLGDNQQVSEDSRYFGPVPESDVLGTVVAAPDPPQSPPYAPGKGSAAR